MYQPTTQPTCMKGNYNCQNCRKPLIPQTPKGPLQPCDGTIAFCQFATASTTHKACLRFNLRSYPCTHSGGTCAGSAIKWRIQRGAQ